MSSNYPPGAANDPNAPWNRAEPKYKEWDSIDVGECELCAKVGDLNEQWQCKDCFDTEQIIEED
jgi:hypothetical protein